MPTRTCAFRTSNKVMKNLNAFVIINMLFTYRYWSYGSPDPVYHCACAIHFGVHGICSVLLLLLLRIIITLCEGDMTVFQKFLLFWNVRTIENPALIFNGNPDKKIRRSAKVHYRFLSLVSFLPCIRPKTDTIGSDFSRLRRKHIIILWPALIFLKFSTKVFLSSYSLNIFFQSWIYWFLPTGGGVLNSLLLYTSDAAADMHILMCVGGRHTNKQT